jgi:hypothetical protein
MTVALTDLLIEISDPRRYAEFVRDPETFLTGWPLSPDDKTALESRNLRKIRGIARSTESIDPMQQFNRSLRARSAQEIAVPEIAIPEVNVPEINAPEVNAPDVHDPIEVEPPHIDVPDHDPDVVASGSGSLFVDINGTYYRAVRG